MRHAAEDYLELRRSLGFALVVPGRHVLAFADHLDALGVTHLTTERAVAWATRPAGAAQWYLWLRLSAVRGFAVYLHGLDPAHQVPPADLLPRQYHRPIPYLLSAAGIAALIDAAGTLRPALHAATYQTIIGLLAVAGLRPSEALTLDITDADLQAGVLTVHGKYGKTREIMLHPTTVTHLAGYAALRDRTFPRRPCTSFFVSVHGVPVGDHRFHYIFARLTRQAGLVPLTPRCKCVPMSMRHSFAVATLVSWYRAGADVDTCMPLLSTWLGHVDPADSYWYISASAELMALAAERMARIYDTPKETP
ncbi:MAG: tyrosine-type recombinase/integrase [Streptosporangiaceae bacterium]